MYHFISCMPFYVPERTIQLKQLSVSDFAIVAKVFSDLALWRHHN